MKSPLLILPLLLLAFSRKTLADARSYSASAGQLGTPGLRRPVPNLTRRSKQPQIRPFALPHRTPEPARAESALVVPRGGAAASKKSGPSPSSEYTAALVKTSLTVLSAVAFGVALGAARGRRAALEFFSGYIVEQSLSVDNIFVFILLFDYFRVPTTLQPLGEKEREK